MDKNYIIQKTKHISLLYIFIIGALIGAVCFVGIYGTRVLDFANTGWLFYGDNDLRQHYIAWCHYRADDWKFPIGLIDSLSYPNSMSVIYTDSIPLFAVVFKIFSNLLPETFQYFGLFGIISFMLMGGLSGILLSRFIRDSVACILGSAFFTLSFQVIHRMYYHTALSAQWIIILALILWVYDEAIKDSRKKVAVWTFMGFLCVAIHSYFLAMIGMILAMVMLQQVYFNRSKYEKPAKTLVLPMSEFIGFCGGGIFALWIFGGFYGGTSAAGFGLGTFSSNLNTFINPIGFGKLLPRLPLLFDFQYEGFGYLGAGILFLFVITAVGMIFRMARKVPEEAFHGNKIYGQLSILVVVISILAATCPIIAFGDKEIIHIPYPSFVEKVLSIFRSNGRLIWVAVYVLMTAAIAFTAYTFRHNRMVAIAVIAIALVLQIEDQSEVFKEKHQYFTADYHVATIWDDPVLYNLADGKKEFIFMYTDNDITLQSAYFGYLHGIIQNNYYFARDIDDYTRRDIAVYMNELTNGLVRDDVVYIFTNEAYLENQSVIDILNLNMVFAYDHVFITK